MNVDPMKIADWFIDFVNKGGALSASAILFAWATGVSFIHYKWLKWQHAEAIKRLEAWQDSSKAEEHQTTAVEKVGDGLKMVSEAQNATATQVAILVALIKDRRHME